MAVGRSRFLRVGGARRVILLLTAAVGMGFGVSCSQGSGSDFEGAVQAGGVEDGAVIAAVAGEPKRSTWADRPLAERIGPMNRSKRAFAVVLSRDGKILLSHRTELESCDGWQLPGGLRTGYESAEANVLREVAEEAGASMETLEAEWFHVDEKVGTAYFRFRYAGTSADQFEVKDPDADFGLPFSDKSAWFALDSKPVKCLISMQENRFKLAHKYVEKFFGLAK